MRELPRWYRALEAARRVAARAGGEIRSCDMAEEMEDCGLIDGTAASGARHIASAWLSKLVRYGYLRRSWSETRAEDRNWSRIYTLTRGGERFVPTRLLERMSEGA